MSPHPVRASAVPVTLALVAAVVPVTLRLDALLVHLTSSAVRCGASGARVLAALLSEVSCPARLPQRFLGGDKRDRTADLLLARQALSQLSYTPA